MLKSASDANGPLPSHSIQTLTEAQYKELSAAGACELLGEVKAPPPSIVQTSDPQDYIPSPAPKISSKIPEPEKTPVKAKKFNPSKKKGK